jgi:hypothetical protein
MNAPPGLRVDMALPLERAPANAENAPRPQSLDPGMVRKAHA